MSLLWTLGQSGENVDLKNKNQLLPFFSSSDFLQNGFKEEQSAEGGNVEFVHQGSRIEDWKQQL